VAIEFRCSQCGKLLRTGDDTAGKQAKCPSCGSVQAIPTSSAPFGPPGEPAPNLPPPPQPSPFSAPAANPFARSLSPELNPNPYASPSPGAAAFDFRGPSGPRHGPPWERDGASVNSFAATVKQFYGSASLFFDDMRREGGLGAPIGFALAGGMLGGLGGFCFQTVLQLMIGAGFGGPAGGQIAAGAGGAAVGLVIVAFLLPIGLMIGLFISSGIYHLMLMMLGGAHYPFETTFRVVAYCQGGSSLLSLIPFCGGLINGIVNIVFTIIGLSRAHEISGGKATLAVLLPVLICCGAFVLIYGAIIALVISQAN
jgi:hypothetical protein